MHRSRSVFSLKERASHLLGFVPTPGHDESVEQRQAGRAYLPDRPAQSGASVPVLCRPCLPLHELTCDLASLSLDTQPGTQRLERPAHMPAPGAPVAIQVHQPQQTRGGKPPDTVE